MKNYIPLLSLTILVSACANPVTKAVNKVKYSAYESVSLEKRDIFKKEVKNAKEDQEDTGEAFKDALTRLKELYGFEGGELEKGYDKLKDSYADASEESQDYKERIAKVNQVASDLFEEWEGEIKEMHSANLKQKSSQQLSLTQKKYKKLKTSMEKAERKMEPVLAKLKDQVIFLKHNLNAQAVTGLKAESDKIENDIEALIKEVSASTKEAEKLIETL